MNKEYFKTEIEIKQCPLCKKKAEIIKTQIYWQVKCTQCGCRVSAQKKWKAIRKWQFRL
jgi:DNA-directed RNA polymerase subunit RPC12/RpoP